MRKKRDAIKSVIILGVLTLTLSGCAQTDRVEINQFMRTGFGASIPYMRTLMDCAVETPEEQKKISDEYGEYCVAQFPDSFTGMHYIYPFKEDETNAYHVIKFEGTGGNPLDFEWIGNKEFGKKLFQIQDFPISNYLELTNVDDSGRLFAMSENYEQNRLDSYENVKWNRIIQADVKVDKEGLFEITEAENGYHVLCNVSSLQRKGYASIYVDRGKDTVTQFVYTEDAKDYDDNRAKEFIDNLQISDGIITQKETTVILESGETMSLIPGDFLDGNPYELSQCEYSGEEKRYNGIGNLEKKIPYLDTTYTVTIKVQDTKPPVLVERKFYDYVLEGQPLALKKYLQMVSANATDASGEVSVYYKENLEQNEVLATKDLCDEEGIIGLTVCMEDVAGNTAETIIKVRFIENNIENTWMEKVGRDVLDFWGLVFEDFGDSDLSLEEQRENIERFLNLENARIGVEIAESGMIRIQYDIEDYSKMASFYTGLSYVPESVLREFSRQGWYVQVVDYKLDAKGQVAGDAAYAYRRIRYTTAVNQSEATMPHEFGHFVDHNNSDISSNPKFRSFYKEREAGRRRTGAQQMDADGIYRDYSFTNEVEFFAESFEMCLVDPYKMHSKYPEIYDSIMIYLK